MTNRWRPDNWTQIKKTRYPSDPGLSFEAGADAMLEALEQDGTHFNKDEIHTQLLKEISNSLGIIVKRMELNDTLRKMRF